jgi:hypothetical protein
MGRECSMHGEARNAEKLSLENLKGRTDHLWRTDNMQKDNIKVVLKKWV